MRLPLVILSVAALAACSTATPYQPALKRNAPGYKEVAIEDNRYRVSFQGNSLTERDEVETYMLYRAAELTVERGFDYFLISDRDTETERRFRDFGSSAGFAGGFGGFGGFGGSRFGFGTRFFHPGFGFVGAGSGFFNDIDIREIKKFESFAEVIMGKGEKPDDRLAFDARQVLINLGPTIVRPKGVIPPSSPALRYRGQQT
ncbi:MAG TPA: hypothetical protein DCZ49_01515 [Hyphomonadaceae bacterium]|nr:hypothetical protein [Hyphomonadaceae bacterium]